VHDALAEIAGIEVKLSLILFSESQSISDFVKLNVVWGNFHYYAFVQLSRILYQTDLELVK